MGVRFAFPTQTLHVEEFPGQISTTPAPPNKDGRETLKESLQDISRYFARANKLDRKEEGKIKPLGGE